MPPLTHANLATYVQAAFEGREATDYAAILMFVVCVSSEGASEMHAFGEEEGARLKRSRATPKGRLL